MTSVPSNPASISLYLHIPFCKKICTYCGFSREVFHGERAQRVTRQISRRMRDLPADYTCANLATIFWGGGTPSCLPVFMLSRILEGIHDTWHLADDCEHTMEVNPEDISPEFACFLVESGINRVSMGVQSFTCLKSLGRRHTAEGAINAVSTLRKAGLKNLNLDLMFALPEQDLPDLGQDLETIIRLAPEHVSCYGLTLEPGTPLAQDVQSGRLMVPDESQWIRMYETIIETLSAAGYVHYEISNFARPGFLCRHNLRIWEGSDYLGLGPGAASRWKQWRFTDVMDPERQDTARDTSRTGLPFVVEAEEVDARGRDIETLLTGLRLLDGFDLCRLETPIPEERICDLRKQGLLWQTHGRVGLTRSGLLVADSVLCTLVNALIPEHGI